MPISKAQRELDERTERVVRRIRARVLRGVLEDEETLDSIYEEVARQLRSQLSLEVSEALIASIVQRALTDAADRVIPIIERRIMESSVEGRETARAVLRLVVSEQREVSGDAPSPFVRRSPRAGKLELVRSGRSSKGSPETE